MGMFSFPSLFLTSRDWTRKDLCDVELKNTVRLLLLLVLVLLEDEPGLTLTHHHHVLLFVAVE